MPESAKQTLEITAAGGHNLLMLRSRYPTGASLLALRLRAYPRRGGRPMTRSFCVLIAICILLPAQVRAQSPRASKNVEWDCTYHVKGMTANFKTPLSKSGDEVTAMLDDLGGLPTRFKILEDSQRALIGVSHLPESNSETRLRVHLMVLALNKTTGEFLMTGYVVGTSYSDEFLGKCTKR